MNFKNELRAKNITGRAGNLRFPLDFTYHRCPLLLLSRFTRTPSYDYFTYQTKEARLVPQPVFLYPW